MRISEITYSTKYLMEEQNQNLPIFLIELWFSKLNKQIPKISQILQFRKSPNFYY